MSAAMMVDNETFALTHNAEIRSIGACIFDPDDATVEFETFYRNIIPHQFGRYRDPATVAYWNDPKRAEAAAVFNSPEPVTLIRALEDLHEFYLRGGCERVYSHGAHFDIPQLEDCYAWAFNKEPWGHRAPRDTRTILEAAGMDFVVIPRRPQWPIHHHALHDACNTAVHVQEAYERLRG